MGPFGRVPPSQLRVSDAERHEVADALSRHFADGRLDEAELDERVGKAMAAKTRGDLAGLLADLPASEAVATPPAAAGGPARRPHPLALAACYVLLFMATVSYLHQSLLWHDWAFRPRSVLLALLVAGFFLLRRGRLRRRGRLGSRPGLDPPA